MKLFISYSRQDSHWVYGLHDNLRENPLHDTWIDRNLVASTDWWDMILTQIEKCDCFIFVMSPDSLVSDYCVTECEYALALNKPILPLMLKDCLNDIPPELVGLKKKQFVTASSSKVPINVMDLLNIERAFTQINNDINSDVYKSHSADRPLVPDDIDDASMRYDQALKDVDSKFYPRAKRRLERVVEANDGIYSHFAQAILDDFDTYAQRHEMYKSIKKLLEQSDKLEKAKQAWERYVEEYGTEYDPDNVSFMLNDPNYIKVYYRIMEAKATQATELDLSELSLIWLPPEIGNLSYLEKLYLKDNQLSKLPPEIGNLVNLEVLSLWRNRLSTLPSQIGHLINLQKLSAFSNQLSELPPEIGNLVNLLELSLWRNRLSTLPSQIGYLTNLRVLNLRDNQLSELPPEIGNLINLSELSLWNNNLKKLSPSIYNLTNLQVLNLRDNQLSKLPPQVRKLTSLRHLNLSSNQLTELPTEIENLANLEVLYLENNELNDLPLEIGKLSKLRYIEVEDNPLNDLPQDIVKQGNRAILNWLREQAREQGLLDD